MFDNIREDLKTHNGEWTCQGFWVMIVYRFGRWRYQFSSGLIRKPLALIYQILYKIIQMMTGVKLPCEVDVGKGFRIDHFNDIIISCYASFGDNCLVRNGVTVGLKNIGEKEAPQIGNNVSIGAGAKILGPVRVGDNVDIGANAVVIYDIPENSLAVGIPARIISKKPITKQNHK